MRTNLHAIEYQGAEIEIKIGDEEEREAGESHQICSQVL